MKKLLLFAVIGAAVTSLLTGCDKIGGGSSGSTGSSGYSSSAGAAPSAGADSGAPISGAHNPEPATLALLASGFAGYFLLRRKKK